MDPVSIIDLNQFNTENTLDGFYVNTLGRHISENQSLITKPHKHNSYLYILFTQGSGKHEIDFSVYDVKPGSCFMIAPGQTHHWSLSSDCDGFILTHTQDFYDLYFAHNRIRQFPFYQSAQNNPAARFEKLDMEQTSPLLVLILKEYHSDSILRLQQIMALLESVYIETSRIYVTQNTVAKVVSGSYYQKFRQLEDLVEAFFLTQKSAAFYAGKMNMTAKHLNRIAKTISGKTTSDIILDRTLLEAKRKIIHQKQSLTQVSYDLGFEDYAYFSRFFKSRTAQTPTDFMKSYQ